MKIWFNHDKTSYPQIIAAIRAEQERGDCCTETMLNRNGVTSALCTRLGDHPGRHIATAFKLCVAAWPGEHEPTLADLEATQ